MAERGTSSADPADSGARTSPDPRAGDAPQHAVPIASPDSTEARESACAAAAAGPDQQPTVISARPHLAAPLTAGGAAPLPLGQDMEGRKLGNFRLEQFVGGGGMGSVYRATDTVLARTVAVKVLSQEHCTDDETARRFDNEAQSAARLDHDNIARVYHVGEDDGLKYIVFEYIEGCNIRDLVHQQGPLPLEETISYVLQVAEAVTHAADRDVVHRDIKPSNVLVTPDGRAKLVDMGLARVEQPPMEGDDLTATGVTLGTFDYISPEQARDPRTADVRSDLYSLGCTFYFMLTGRPPFPEGTVLQKLLSHSSEEPTDPQLLRPDLPDEVAAILRRLLAKNPGQRYQEPSELVGELLLAAEHLGLHPASQGGTVWISSSSPRLSPLERHLPWAAPMLILTIVVLALDWVWPSNDQANSSAPTMMSVTLPPAGTAVQPLAADAERAMTDSAPTSGRPSTEAPGDQSAGATDGLAHSSADSPSLPESPDRPIVAGSGGPSQPVESSTPTAAASNTQNGQNGQMLPPETDASGPPEYRSAAGPSTSLPPHGVAESWQQTAGTDTGTVPVENPSYTETVPRSDVLIVGDYDSQSSWDRSQFCPSLQSACRRALTSPNIQLIELRYDGFRDEPDQPLTLANPDLTIRAGEGFAPVVYFRPQPSASPMSPSSMIRIVGGNLRIEGIQFELDLPIESEGRWELFQLEQVEQLVMDRCFLTVRDPLSLRGGYSVAHTTANHQRVAVIDLQTPPGSDPMMDDGQATMDGWSVMNLWNCVIRGETTVVRAVEALPFRLKWVNGLLAVTGRMLDIGGTRSDPDEDHIRVDLEHVTAVTANGLCRVQTDDERCPFVMTVDINSSQCIFMTTPAVPLIQYIATVQSDPAELDNRLLYSGERNFYENVNVCWSRKVRIRDFDDQQQQEDLDAEEWKERWKEKLAKWNKVRWLRLPGPTIPMHDHTPTDYYLEAKLGNPAIESGPGPNGGNAGFDPDLLRMPCSHLLPATRPNSSTPPSPTDNPPRSAF